MNPLIESLNDWGVRFLQFAWPMLWQSTLLIALVFAVEFALRRKIRPAVRYALWLAVLIKLLLPPSLALPTSLAWWLRPGTVAPAATPAPTFVVISQVFKPSLPLSYYEAPAVRPAPAPARATLSPAAWLLIGWSCISLELLGWLAVRWRRVTGKVHRAATTPSPASGVALQELFDEAKRAAGVKRVVRLRLVEQPISPAVYGLVYPVILLPQSLVERIGPEQLRAVLLHELIHFRRADVWINCAQSLLQIVYWWHPLVWFANARIRRVREEAVDDAVMLALRGDAEHYAPALLEVAKLALNRPLATLGLVGILESRSALKHRIERLMNFTTPGRAGLSIMSVFGVAAFSALALPMGEAPPKPPKLLAQAGHDRPMPARIQSVAPSAEAMVTVNVADDGTYRLGTNFVDLPQLRVVFLAAKVAAKESAQKFHVQIEAVANARSEAVVQLCDLCQELDVAAVSIRTQSKFEVRRFDVRGNTLLDQLTVGAILADAKGTNVSLNRILDAVDNLQQAYRERGFPAVAVALPPQRLTNGTVQVDVVEPPLTNAGVLSPKSSQPELYTRSFRVDPSTFFLRLQEAGAVSDSANAAPNGQGQGVLPSVRAGGTGFENWNGSNGDRLKLVTIINYFLSIGVDLRLETGKNVFYGDRYGNLLFNATKQDLDIIEAALQTLNTPQPQINLKVKFVEVGSNALAPDSILGDMVRPKLPARSSSDETNASAPFMLSGILTDPQYRTVLHALKQRGGSDVLNEAQVTTLSGRQAQIQVTDERFLAAAIATATRGSANGGGNTNTVIPSVIPSGFLTNTPIPLGPTIDLIPVLGADGFTIQLTLIPTLVDFTGYGDPGKMIVVVQGANSNGVSTPLTAQLPLPHFRIRQVTVNAIVWDGQTLVLSGPALYDPRRTQEKVPVLGDLPVVGRLFRSETNAPAKKNLLIFVTPTIIDPAGNRLHPEGK